MNRALASVLSALGYQVQPFGTGGASLISGPRRSARRRIAGPGPQRADGERGRPGERRLATMFGEPSRRWARRRMAEANANVQAGNGASTRPG